MILETKNAKRKVELIDFMTVKEAREFYELEGSDMAKQDKMFEVCVKSIDGETDKAKMKELILRMDIKDYFEISEKLKGLFELTDKKK